MNVGEKKRIWVPESLAPKGQASEKGSVVYDVELVSIKREPAPPKNLTPPKDAKTTESGLSYKIIRKVKTKQAKSPLTIMLSVNAHNGTPMGD